MLLIILLTFFVIILLSGVAVSLSFNAKKARVRSAVAFSVGTLGMVFIVSFTYLMELAMPDVVVTFDDYAMSALIIIQTGLIVMMSGYGSLTYAKNIYDRAQQAERDHFRNVLGIAEWERKAQEIFG